MIQKPIYLLLSLFLWILICPLDSHAQKRKIEDVIYLKDGSVIRGNIKQQIIHQSITIVLLDGTELSFETAKIDRVTRETSLYSSSNLTYRNRHLAFKYYQRPNHYIGWDLGLGFDQGPFGPVPVFHTHIHGGYEIKRRLYVGMGTGMDPYSRGIVFPAYVVGKYILQDKAFTPILYLKGGYGWGAFRSWNTRVFQGGPMGAATVGVRIMNRKQDTYEFSVGYKGQLTRQEYAEFQWSPTGIQEEIVISGSRLYQNIIWQFTINL